MKPYIIDAHEDLAYNMLTFRRDYTRAAHDTRSLEAGSFPPTVNGDTLLGYPDYTRGNVAVVFGTLFAGPRRRSEGEWDFLSYRDENEAHRSYRSEVDAYERLTDEHSHMFRLIRARADLARLMADRDQAAEDTAPVGLVMLMEGAEGVRSIAELDEWWELGVRIIGPAWAGTRFCGGTGEPGPLTMQGRELLAGMADRGFVLDLSHMDAAAALQALDLYPGQIIASHANPYSMVKRRVSNRFLPDEVVDRLLERDGVIGIVPFNRFLNDGWEKTDPKEKVSLREVAAHMDYICQRAGDARHVALGSDFDGGYGVRSVPAEVDTIADLQLLCPILAEMGYTETDVAAILGGNWRSKLEASLPES